MKCNSIDKDILYVLTAKGGEKFLGHSAALVNPCGDICEPDSYRGGYAREGSDDLIPEDEIVSAVRIDPFDCFYWDDEENDYVPFVVEYPKEGPVDPEGSLRRMYGLWSLSRDVDRAFRQLDQAAMKLKVMKIRSWLLVNAKCDGAVYVDSDYGIRCQGTIEILPGVDLPDVIADGLAKGQR